MIQVDPAGLASTAQRIADVLAELMGGDPVHPPLGADPASAGAAARLSTAGASLVAVIGQQALGLAVTAAQLLNVSTTFEVQDLLNKSGLDKLGIPDLITVTGWAPPSPPIPPDVRPALMPPPPVPGEALSTAVHSGDPNAGAAFISAWRELVSALEGAADTVRATAAQLPEQWDSPVSTDAVRDHLYCYAQAFDTSASRASTLAWQADRHAEQNVTARNDIPTPRQYAELRQQIQTVSAANIASGGRYAAQLTQLLGEMTALDSKTMQGYGALHSETEATTAGDGDGADAAAVTGAASGDPAAGAGDPRQPGKGGDGMSPEKAGQLASMLPQLLPALLGAAGGLVGGAVQMIGKAPETLMQAGSQMAGQVSQSLGGLMNAGLDSAGLEKASRSAGSRTERGEEPRSRGSRWRRHGAGRWRSGVGTARGHPDHGPAAEAAVDARWRAAAAGFTGIRSGRRDADGDAAGRDGRRRAWCRWPGRAGAAAAHEKGGGAARAAHRVGDRQGQRRPDRLLGGRF